MSLTNGKVRQVKHYTAKTVDWMAVYDATTDCCYYVPSSELGGGRYLISLRLRPAKNNQRIGVRYAIDYRSLERNGREVEPAGIEPATSALQTPRSSI
jgi:hypothetical protein